MSTNFKEIVKNFLFNGEFIEAVPYGSGHINDTYAASFRKKGGNTHRYILQRINHRVFSAPEKLMENITAITRHLRTKIVHEGGDPERETMNIISTLNGESFFKSEEGDYWRSYVFIEGAHTYDVVDNLRHFYSGGKAFGIFQRRLGDFPALKLYESIPDFHNTPKRMDNFIKVLEKDSFNRAVLVKNEVDFALKRANDASVLADLLKRGILPQRVTHNDTKFNNVMIDDITGEGVCVIDLDTVMPGSALYDFGDSIRSGANPAAEDERDLSKVIMDINLYEHFSHGYLDSARDFLTKTEIEYLPFAAKLMTFECGVRFLTDYLDGDNYFKVHREGHNLDRARTQFKMVADMERKLDLMAKIIERYK